MKLRHPEWNSEMSGTITSGLSLAPLMAQSTPDVSSLGVARHADDTAFIVKETWNPIVDMSVLTESPGAPTATAFRNVTGIPLPWLPLCSAGAGSRFRNYGAK